VTGHDDLCVSRVPIFRGLEPAELAAVARLAHPVHLSQGEVAYHAGTAPGRLLVVHQGRLALTHRDADGHQQVVRVLQAGDFIGEEAFLSGSRPDHDAVAATDGQLCTFSHADLAGLVRRHPGIAVQMLRTVSSRLADADRRLAALARTDVSARLAGYLLELPVRLDGDGQPVIELPMARKVIASYLGTTPESLSRALTALTRAGTIRPQGRRDLVLLDPDALEARARR